MSLNFNEVYRQKYWTQQGKGSGPGSTLANTTKIRGFLKKFISSHNITSILDVSVGGMNWWPDVLKEFSDIEFYGYDVARDIIESHKITYEDKNRWHFKTGDILSDDVEYPSVDLIICRHTLQHLSMTHSKFIIDKLWTSPSKWVALTTCVNIKKNPLKDKHKQLLSNTPGCFKCRPMNMMLSPFNLSSPTETVKDDNERAQIKRGQELGFWKIKIE